MSDLEPIIESVDGSPVGISGGGGGGGGTSDNVTIQGDGSGGSPFAVKNLGITTGKLAALAVTAAKIANATITDAQVAVANIDGLAAVASLRTLGTGAQQAMAGNDSRVTNALQKDGSVSLTGNLPAGGNKITGAADPTAAQDYATKAYVDAAAQGFDLKASVRAATTANITLSGAQTIDGVSVIAGDRVLVKNQSTASQNGIYVAASGAWSRATDADSNVEVTSGLFTYVSEGTINGTTSWALTTADPITLGTTSLAFTQTHGPGTYTAGTGLSLTGTQFAIDNTVVTLSGSQTLTNKTLTSPAINGAVLSGTLSGNHTVSGVATFTAAPIVAIDDATSSDITDVITLRHTYNAGNGANGIAAGLLFQTEDNAGNVQDTAAIRAILLNATSTSETSAIDFWPWSSGALTRRMRLGSDGGLLIGTTLATGGPGIGLPRDVPIYGGNSGSTAYAAILQVVAGTQVELGNNVFNTVAKGNPLSLFSFGTVAFAASSVTNGVWSNGSMQWGASDASATPANFVHRGSNATGTNIAGAVMTMRAPLGTGTGTVGIFRIEGGQLQASGTTAHSTVTLAEFSDTDTDNDTMFLVRTRKGGVEAVERVTLVAAASVAGSGRNFLSVS